MFNFKKSSFVLLFLETIAVCLANPTFVHPDAHLGNGGLGNFNGYHGGVQEAAHAILSNDHHGGVSIVGAGASAQKGITIDLTKEHGGGHTGLFGGSFLSTGAHGKTGGYYQGGNVEHIHTDPHSAHAGLGSYSSALSSYDVGHGLSDKTPALTSSGHDIGEISPVLYSSNSPTLHGGDSASGLGGFDDRHHGYHASLPAPAHFEGGGYDQFGGFGHH